MLSPAHRAVKSYLIQPNDEAPSMCNVGYSHSVVTAKAEKQNKTRVCWVFPAVRRQRSSIPRTWASTQAETRTQVRVLSFLVSYSFTLGK